MNRNGLSLIELMIYLAISMLVVTLFCSLMIALYTSAQQRAHSNDTALTLCIALNTIAQDSKRFTGIKEASAHRCIITTEDKDLGWVFKKGKLMRYAGYYNTTTRKWAHVSSSQLAAGLTQVQFSYECLSKCQGGHLIGIQCHLTKNNISLTQYTGVV